MPALIAAIVSMIQSANNPDNEQGLNVGQLGSLFSRLIGSSGKNFSRGNLTERGYPSSSAGFGRGYMN